MKRALIIIAIILLVAAVVGVVFLGALMMNNYAETGSVFGSNSNISGSFWENLIGDEILNEVRPGGVTEPVSSDNQPMLQGDFIFEELGDGTYSVKANNFSFPDAILRFPESFNGKPVTVISKSVNSNNTIRQVFIPDSVTTINDEAFRNFSALEIVLLGKNVVHINPAAFMDCTSLKNLYLNDNLKFIYKSAFNGCSSLKELFLPDGLKVIDHHAFDGCSALVKVRIPHSITQIGQNAFYGCSSLTSINIPGQNIELINGDTFNNCKKLQYVEIGEGIEVIPTSMFSGCKSLIEIKLPTTLKIISSYAFYNCQKLKTIDLPNGILSISSGAFFDCSSLERMEIPASVTSLQAAFGGCDKLTLEVNSGNPKYYSTDNCIIDRDTKTLIQGMGNSIIPDDVTMIGSSAFAYSDLEAIVLSPNITEIKSYAFAHSAIKEITLPENIEYIAEGLLMGCYDLESIILPEKITTIETNAFAGCLISQIDIKGNISKIDQRAFSDTALTSISINGDNLVVYFEAFAECPNLASVTFTGTIKSLNGGAFSHCRALKKIDLPKDIEEMSTFIGAFCSLEEINYNGTLAEWEAISKSKEWGQNLKPFKIVLTDAVKQGGSDD